MLSGYGPGQRGDGPVVNVFALDFDGVLCDSVVETGVTAWRAGAALWPEWQTAEPPPAVLDRFIACRPVLETGFEAIPMMRLAYEGVDPGEVAARCRELCEEVMLRTGVGPDELAERFGSERDGWIRSDLRGWLGRHRFYPGVIEAVRQRLAADADDVYILTTKQERFVKALLSEADLALPAERIYGLERRCPKEETLRELLLRERGSGRALHFVEDRVATLFRIAAVADLCDVRLYLAMWGYNTAEERDRAASCSAITSWRLEQFLAV